MATYGTDLVVLATGSDGESGTWVELLGWASGGSPGAETENFIQGTQSQSQTFGNQTTGKSIAFDAGSDISGSIPSGDVITAWVFMGAPTNMYNYSTGGHSFGIAADNAGVPSVDMDIWYISGDDRPPNPYGGWWNIAIDPATTPDTTTGAGSGGVWWYFGSMIGTSAAGVRVKISKGNPHAVDGMRMGRGEIYCTGTGATFTLMAADNDAVSARWGLLQDTGGGTFLWKGLMSLGQSGTSTTFAASNQTVVIDDTAKVTSGFNKIEIRHASSSITWDNISFTARGTVSKGQFEMVENAATMAWTGCSFNNMDTFIFLSNAVLIGCIWNGCGVITHGGADFEGCSFAGYEGTADTALMDYNGTVDINGEIDNSSFTMGTALTHAISFTDNTTTTHTLTGVDFSGYGAENTNSSALYFPDSGSDIDWIINLSGCTGTINFKKVRAGDTVTLIADPVTTKVIAKDADSGDLLENARVLAWVTSGVNFPYLASVTIAGSGTTATVTHTSHGLATGDNVWIQGANEENYRGAYQITVTGVNTYTYTTVETGTGATGTITSTFVFINGDTDVNGEIEDTRVVTVNQPIDYRVRKSTTAPLYVQSTGSTTVDNTLGITITANLVSDE